MKRILSFIMVLVLVLLCIAGCSSTGNKKDSQEINEAKTKNETKQKSLYKQYVSDLIKTLDKDKQETGFAKLYDINSDGVDELIILHVSDVTYVYTVCTIKDGEVLPLIEDVYFFILAGGPSGEAILFDNGDETYLSFEYIEVNPGDNVLYNRGTLDMYTFDGEKLILAKEIEFNELTSMSDDRSIYYDESEVTINGETLDYKEYKDWYNGFEKNVLVTIHSDETYMLENFGEQL